MYETDQFDMMGMFLQRVVDSFEKLEVIVHLFKRQTAQCASAISLDLTLSPRSVTEALAVLQAAGVIRARDDDDQVVWRFDPRSSWATTVEVLVELYELDRDEILGLMKQVGLEEVRSRSSVGYSFVPRRGPVASS